MIRFRVRDVAVSIDAWFLFVLVFVYAWAGGGRAGLFAAAAAGVFTVIHELGHVAMARRVRCRPAMRLNHLLGWTGLDDARRLSPARRVAISLAGPLAEIAVVVPVLAVVHHEMQRRLAVGDTHDALVILDVWTGVVWAGLILALLNLLPLWPLDGGHVIADLLRRWRGDRSPRTVAAFTLYTCAGLVVLNVVARTGGSSWLLSEERRVVAAPLGVLDHSFVGALWVQVRAFPGRLLFAPWFLLLFCGLASRKTIEEVSQRSHMSSWLDVAPRPLGPPERRREERSGNDRAHALERAGWRDGALGRFPSGWGPSPWLHAHHNLAAGDVLAARAALGALTEAGGLRWSPPELDQPELATLLALAPAPLPVGAAMRSRVLLAVVARHGSPEQIADYAGRLYQSTRDTEVLYLAAGGLARAGRGDDAMAWLRRAVVDHADVDRLARDRGLAALHDRLDFQQLLATVRAESG
jgi:Zn-dependent protease